MRSQINTLKEGLLGQRLRESADGGAVSSMQQHETPNLDDAVFRFVNVSKVFKGNGEAVVALNKVNLEIKRGAFQGIVGTSGAGKSTLLRLINLLEAPSAGSIEFNGTDLAALSASAQREYLSKVATIFQHFNLFHGKTVLDNVTFPLAIRRVSKQERTARGLAMLRLVGLENRETHYPSQLSGGQKQRVGIARALITNPDVLICDEATSALDSSTTKTILDLLIELKRLHGFTVVLITHSWDVVRYACDSAALVEDGRITESGTLQEIVKRGQSIIKDQLLPLNTDNLLQQDDPYIFDLTFEDPEQQTDALSKIAAELGLDFSILSGRVDAFGATPIARFKVKFHPRQAGGSMDTQRIAVALQARLVAVNARRDAR